MSLFRGMSVFSRLSLTYCFAFTMGCGDGGMVSFEHAQSDIQQTVIDGELEEELSSVVGLKIMKEGNESTCTGSLISPYLILTARHCIAGTLNRADEGGILCGYSTFGKTIRPSQVTITTAYAFKKPGAVFHPVKEIIVPKGNRWCSGDIALLVLEEPILSLEVAPLVPRIESPVFVDEPYSVVGYGKVGHDKDSRSGARRRRAGLSVSCTVDDCEDGDHRSVDNELEWLDRNGAHCNGDSGGPALDNFGRVIGIVSRSRSLGEEICTSNHTYTSVYDWAEWIQYHTRAVSAEEGVESAPWTMGYSTLPEYNFPVGETCEGGGDCLSGLCHEGVCIRSCSDEGPCPSGFQCQGDTLRQVCIPEAEGSEESSFEDNSAEDAGGCASANGTPLALLGLWWARRRRQRRD